MEIRGTYTGKRAAALSGVPLSTVHYWARKSILVPSVSAEKVKLWSYSDLMGLRVIYWLRSEKDGGPGAAVPRTTMSAVRLALDELRGLDLALWTEGGGPTVAVDRAGNIVLDPDPNSEAGAFRVGGQFIAEPDWLDVLRPFPTDEGSQGPDLRRPRPKLRIVPGKLSGSPHVELTRIETVALAALSDRGMSGTKIRSFYPALSAESVSEALDLERQLRQNLAGEARAAA